jgi:hypothetical protein
LEEKVLKEGADNEKSSGSESDDEDNAHGEDVQRNEEFEAHDSLCVRHRRKLGYKNTFKFRF